MQKGMTGRLRHPDRPYRKLDSLSLRVRTSPTSPAFLGARVRGAAARASLSSQRQCMPRHRENEHEPTRKQNCNR